MTSKRIFDCVETGESLARKMRAEVRHRLSVCLDGLDLGADDRVAVQRAVDEAVTEALPPAALMITLKPEQAARLGHDAWSWADQLHSAMVGAAAMRSARMDKALADATIFALDRKLIPALEGVRDAAIRTHEDAGGTVDELAVAMDVPRSTAGYHRKKLLGQLPTSWEAAAWRGGPDRQWSGPLTYQRLDQAFTWNRRVGIVQRDAEAVAPVIGELMVFGDCDCGCVAKVTIRDADGQLHNLHARRDDLLTLVDPPSRAEVAATDIEIVARRRRAREATEQH